MASTYDLIYSAIQTAADLGYGLSNATEKRPVRIAQREDGTFYAGITEHRGDYDDTTLAFAGPVDNPEDLINVQDNFTRMIFNFLTRELEKYTITLERSER